MRKGMIYVFTGDGKGKTSAALGTVMRMLVFGKKVAWVSWYKWENFKSLEMRLDEVLTVKVKSNLKMYWMGKGFYFKLGDLSTTGGHKKMAGRALSLCESILSGKIPGGGKVDLLVMDEVIKAVDDGLVSLLELKKVLRNRGKTHVVLTGRGRVEEMLEEVDLVSKIEKVKHPFDEGKLAVKGLDF